MKFRAMKFRAMKFHAMKFRAMKFRAPLRVAAKQSRTGRALNETRRL